MAKNYSREEIKELLKEKLKAAIIFQDEEEDYDNEYHILNKLPNGTYKHVHGAVVTMLCAIKNESDFGSNEDWKEFIIDLAKKLADDEEITEIRAHIKLSPEKENDRDNLFWREY